MEGHQARPRQIQAATDLKSSLTCSIVRFLKGPLYRRVLTQLFELRIVCHLFKPNLLRNLTVHTEHRGDFLLSKQQNLQHEMVAFLTSTAHAGLAHQDEARQGHCCSSWVPRARRPRDVRMAHVQASAVSC